MSLSKRAMVGVLASFGNAGLHHRDAVAHVLHRLPMSAFSLNSTLVWLRPSKLREVMRLTPAMLLSASSMSLVTSRSTASGDAPG